MPAFMARKTADRTYSPGELIQFDDEISDLGGYHQADNGVFICPHDGIYVFSVHIFTMPGQFASGMFYIDGTAYTSAWAAQNAGGTGVSTAYVGWCSAGSQAYVEAEGGTESHVRGGRHTVFTGFLLKQNND